MKNSQNCNKMRDISLFYQHFFSFSAEKCWGGSLVAYIRILTKINYLWLIISLKIINLDRKFDNFRNFWTTLWNVQAKFLFFVSTNWFDTPPTSIKMYFLWILGHHLRHITDFRSLNCWFRRKVWLFTSFFHNYVDVN